MSERPLLLFPTPEAADRNKLFGRGGNYHKPSVERQGNRLSPMFTQLITTFEARRVELQQSTAGIEPEQALVIETIGSIEDFSKAVKHISGFEWMSEIEIDEISPDNDFYDNKNPEKELSGRLYLIMSNQRALEEMLSLWKRYQDNQKMTFERGLTKFRDVFLHLKNIRLWDVQDRLLETGVIEAWNEDLEHNGDRVVRFETELWFRSIDLISL